MERTRQAHQRLSGARRLAPLLLGLALLGLLLALAGCGGKGPRIVDDSGERWMAKGASCVRMSDERPTRRVVNTVDPELCGRSLKHRSGEYVRVIPPPGMRSR